MKVISYSKLNEIIIHHNETDKLLIKSTYNTESIQSIINEFEGFNWYFSKKSNFQEYSKRLSLNVSDKFARIEIPEIKGFSVKASNQISINEKFIIRAIDEYLQISNLTNFRFHGDFSIGNMIFTELECYIIDWEHSLSNLNLWGLDILNIYYESLFFSFHKNKLSEANKLSLIKVYKYLLEIFNNNGKQIISLSNLIEIYRENNFIWGNSISKLPVLKFNEKQILLIESIERNNN